MKQILGKYLKYNLYFLQFIFLPGPYFVSIQTEMEIDSDFSQNEQNHPTL